MTAYSRDSARAALLLTNRLVSLAAAPMTAREFWALAERVDPADLLQLDPAAIAERLGTGADEAARVRALLDASTALSFEQERLHDGGVSLVSALDAGFPSILRDRLGTASPPFLLVAGPIEWLARPGLGIAGSTGSSRPGEQLLDVARQAAGAAVERGWPVVAGLGGGIGEAAMAAAADAGAVVIGVPAEGISRASRSAEVRRRVHAGRLCLVSPYAPTAPFRTANAVGRNTIVHALSSALFVVGADTKDTFDRAHVPVAVWAGEGASNGSQALVRSGATPVTDVANLAELFDLEPPEPPARHDALF